MIYLPLQAYDLLNIEPGPAILFVGLMGILLWSAVTFRNPLGVVMWGITVLMFAFSGMLDFAFEFVWIGVATTTILIVIGVAVRVG